MESTSFDEAIRHALKWFIRTQGMQNLEFVNLKCVTYTQPIPLLLIWVSKNLYLFLWVKGLDSGSKAMHASQCLLQIQH